MKAAINSKGDRFVEFPMATKAKDERIRVTLVSKPNKAWTNGPTVRIQKRNAKGLLSQGPEFPVSNVVDLLSATVGLTTIKENA